VEHARAARYSRADRDRPIDRRRAVGRRPSGAPALVSLPVR
jgi:hypothetical protein